MMFKAIFASVVGLAAMATSAPASTLTFLLSSNDDGTGTAAAGSYAIYAFSSAGDNAGIAAFSVTTSGQSATLNRSPRATFTANDGVSDDRSAGFTFLRSNGSSGVASTGAFDTVSGNGVFTGGIGQATGNVRNSVPANFAASTTVAQGAFGVTNSFTASPITNGSFTGTGGQVPVLVVSGTGSPVSFTGVGNLFTGSGMSVVAPSEGVIMQQRNLLPGVPEPASLAVLGLAAGGLMARRRRVA